MPSNHNKEREAMRSKIKLLTPIISALLLFVSCQSTNKALTKQPVILSQQGIMLSMIKQAEKEADKPGKAVLETGRKMVLEDKAIVTGSCWTWVNECFIRAGYGANRYIAFKSKKAGPYIDVDEIKPGDWLYFVNHSYRRIGHSGIFVYWVDKDKKIGVTMSYRGRNKQEPGRYKKYLLKDVYYITRPGAEEIKTAQNK
jgi:hypothetical protein